MDRALRLTFAAGVASALALSGCAGLQDLARSAFVEPKLDFKGATMDALDLEGATVGLHVDLTNPNGFGLDVARVGWSFDAQGTRVATGDMPGGLKIPASGVAPLTIPVRVRWKDVPGIIGLFTTARDGLRYKAAASVGVNTPIGVVELPLVHEADLRLPQLPSFSVSGLSVRSASLTEVAFDVKVGMKNPNAFPVPAGQLDWSLALGGGAPVARAEGAPTAAVSPGSTGTITLPVRVDLRSAGRAATDLALGGNVRVRMLGTASVAGLDIPLDLDSVVPARR
jgi:LEA14-like dessication related protein